LMCGTVFVIISIREYNGNNSKSELVVSDRKQDLSKLKTQRSCGFTFWSRNF